MKSEPGHKSNFLLQALFWLYQPRCS